jgi:hypothetical protein
MRGGVVAGGVTMMVIGGFMFIVVPFSPASYQSGGANPISIGVLGAIIGFIGFLVFIAGLAASPDPPELVRYRTAGNAYGDFDASPRPPYRMPTNGPSPRTPPIGYSELPPSGQASAPLTAGGSGLVGPSSQGRPIEVVPADSAFCPFDGEPIAVRYQFCRKCGRRLSPGQQ